MAVYKQTKSKNWWYKFTWNGELIRESTKQTNKRVAEQLEAARKASLAKGEVGIRSKKAPLFDDFANEFERAIETLCSDKPATVSFYKAKLALLKKHGSFKGRRIDQIDEHVIEGFKQSRTATESRRKKPLSVASVNRELATLRRMIRLAHEWKLLDRIPKIRLLRGEKSREFVLSHKDEVVYLSALDGDLHDVAVLLLDTGLRMGEALGLEWPDVRLVAANGAKFGYLTVRAGNAKNSKTRNVPLSARTLKMLAPRASQSDGKGYVFASEGGGKLPQTWLNEQHRAVRDRLKLTTEFVPHSLRHTFGTRLGESGADVFTIMKLMGHSTVTVSQRYVHPSPESVERAYARLEQLNGEARKQVGIVSGIDASGRALESAQVI